MSSAAIVVFGRQPVPGAVKTRLARTVGARVAAEVYAQLLEHTLAQALATGLPVVLMLAESPSPGWLPPVGVPVEVQAEGDLGQRMLDAFGRRFDAGHTRTVIVGSDCPGLLGRHLDDAIAALDRKPLVIGPATDGGYWLVGQRAPGRDVFSGVRWSSPDTLAMTRTRAARAGLEWIELDELGDVDTEGDLREILAAGGVDHNLARALAGCL